MNTSKGKSILASAAVWLAACAASATWTHTAFAEDKKW